MTTTTQAKQIITQLALQCVEGRHGVDGADGKLKTRKDKEGQGRARKEGRGRSYNWPQSTRRCSEKSDSAAIATISTIPAMIRKW